VSTCKSCGATIRWAVTTNDRSMPLDPEPVPDGNLEIIGTRQGLPLVRVAEAQLFDDGPRYLSHFATCPQAPEHRKAQSGGPGVKLARDARGTSVAAAERVYPVSGTQRYRVWQVIRARGAEGATDHEIADETGIKLNSVQPRRIELVERDLVRDSGRRRTHGTYGKATVWVDRDVEV
jgi:hypothetical protein